MSKQGNNSQGDRKKGTRPSLTGSGGEKPLGERRGKSKPAAKSVSGSRATGKSIAGKSTPGDRTSGSNTGGKRTPAPGTRPDSRKTARPTRPKSTAPGKKAKPSKGMKGDPELVRLNKFIASAGICSRREADSLISAGLITVNGKPVSELGSKVKPDDDVRYNGQRLQNEKKVYLLLNKPKDYVTTTDDPKERRTVMLLVREACNERIYPVGRLDRHTTGVLLFTNDGEMAKKLTHPSYNKKKIYHVFLDKSFTAGDMKTLAEGVELEDGFIQPDALSYANRENKKEIGLEIHSGKNRVVRRMFQHLGYRVSKLDRVYYGGLTKKDLPRGHWRFLTEKEISMLKMNAYE